MDPNIKIYLHSTNMKEALLISPLASMMAIPGCFGGDLIRGSNSPITNASGIEEMICPEPGICYCPIGKHCSFRSCGNS